MQLLGINPLSLSNNKSYRLKQVDFFLCHKRKIAVKPTIRQSAKIQLSQKHYTCFFYKQLGSGLSPQSCSYFQRFGGSKWLNGCLVAWSSNLCLRGMQSIFLISDFKIFLVMLLRQVNHGVLPVSKLFQVYCKGKIPLIFNL